MARPAAPKPQKTLEQRLWDAAGAMRGNQEPSEYKHVVLGLVFLERSVALKAIAREQVTAVRASATIDWNLKDKRPCGHAIQGSSPLARYYYPPDAEAKAIDLVLEQAELLTASATQ